MPKGNRNTNYKYYALALIGIYLGVIVLLIYVINASNTAIAGAGG